ncbi:MAG: hypothetical protein K0U64_12715 [Actinomycetia bacterium]|nr:hypothetical protein [Actinomycetes bacterium]
MPQSQNREDHDADRDEDDEQILREADDWPFADKREGEASDEQFHKGLEHGNPEHDKTGEDQHVGNAGNGPLQQLPLS